MVSPQHHNRRFLAPGDKLGKYELIRQIAVGGMAELYLARTVGIEGFEKLVCVKRILPQYVENPSFVNMFLNEARLAATLHHPNVTQVYDIGQEAADYFFTMEYVHGEDLGRIVVTGRENGVPISLDASLTLVAGLCAGLHYAHEKAGPEGNPLGIVHRDVSPTNVLVSYDGAVKLVDFGIARVGSGSGNTQGGLKGKIAYMSPEQCRGKATLDRRSDVFSVGTILYELTTGQLPFTDETEYGVLSQIVNEDAAPPSKLVAGYPPALEAIVMRALARDVEQRYATALDLQHAVEDFAHENRLRVSPLVLARLMSTLFPTRLEEWDHARAQGAFFVEQHVVRTLIESGKTADSAPRAPALPAPPSGFEEETTLASPPSDTSETGPTSMMTLKGPVPVLLPPRDPSAEATEPGQLPGVRYPAQRISSPGIPRTPNPGAVPIVLPLTAPPIAQGGTLVSSSSPMLPQVIPTTPYPHHSIPVAVAVTPAGEITERVRIPTPSPRAARSRLPVIVVSAAGALGAILAVVLVTRSGGDPSEAAPVQPVVAPTPPPAEPPAPPPAAPPVVETPPPPKPVEEPPPPAPPPKVEEPPKVVEKKVAKPPKPKPAHVAKPKPKPKEQPWNDDSPFMPVRTEKH